MIKLIWDFRGPEARKIAEHHAKHLAEFASRESLEVSKVGVDTATEMHHIAWMLVTKEEMPKVRDALIPHRGEQVE